MQLLYNFFTGLAILYYIKEPLLKDNFIDCSKIPLVGGFAE